MAVEFRAFSTARLFEGPAWDECGRRKGRPHRRFVGTDQNGVRPGLPRESSRAVRLWNSDRALEVIDVPAGHFSVRVAHTWSAMLICRGELPTASAAAVWTSVNIGRR